MYNKYIFHLVKKDGSNSNHYLDTISTNFSLKEVQLSDHIMTSHSVFKLVKSYTDKTNNDFYYRKIYFNEHTELSDELFTLLNSRSLQQRVTTALKLPSSLIPQGTDYLMTITRFKNATIHQDYPHTIFKVKANVLFTSPQFEVWTNKKTGNTKEINKLIYNIEDYENDFERGLEGNVYIQVKRKVKEGIIK